MERKLMKNTFILITLCAVLQTVSAAESPYGVCAHLNRWEYPEHPKELELMNKGGIGWVRTDLDWNQVENKKGEWNFERWDAVLKNAAKNKVEVLPILAGAQPRWATPLAKHMPEWKNYLRTVLKRYGSTMKYWEVVNEPDLNEFSDGAAYGKFLAETYREIKKNKPDAVVLTGGLGNIPLPYIEKMIKAGGKDCFDIINIHPYYWQDYPENALAHELQNLRRLMNRHGIGHKQIWMTETGYATAAPVNMTKITRAALQKLNLDRPDLPILLIRDVDSRYASEGLNLRRENFFGTHENFREITLKELKNLDPKKNPLIFMAGNESFPMRYAADLLAYVKNGGTLFFPGGGIPLYFNMAKYPDGTVIREGTGENIQKMFHIGWDAWWMKKGIPKGTKELETAPEFKGKITFPQYGSRFLSTRNLKEGDRLIPIVTGFSKDKKFSAPVAGIYRFNSDLKGNIIAFNWSDYTHSTTEEMQAKLLPRTILIARANGVHRLFWYSFRANESVRDSREYHFGIMHRNLTPKPAYQAYATLTKMCPPGSSVPIIRIDNSICIAEWKTPEGKNITALWSIDQPIPSKLESSAFKEAVDYLGNPVRLPKGRMTASSGILYLVRK